VTPRTRQLALDLTAGKNSYDAARAIEGYVRGRITYRTDIGYPPADQDVVDYALFDSLEGYCEYYSSAMVVLLRSVGIPAREVVGLTGGSFDAQSGQYLYRESGAHAWPEAYFPGYGWIGFEPTAAYPVATSAAAVIKPAPATGGPPLRIVVPATAILVTLIVAPLIIFRRRTSAVWYYQRLVRAGALVGVSPPPATTPSERARLLASRLPEARQAIETLTDLYVREEYGVDHPATRELQQAWRDVRRAVFRRRLHLPGNAERH
jgi:hypothetical protein